jgi:hypothetical protein
VAGPKISRNAGRLEVSGRVKKERHDAPSAGASAPEPTVLIVNALFDREGVTDGNRAKLLYFDGQAPWKT